MMVLVRDAGAVHLSLRSLRDVAPPGVTTVPIHDLPPAPVALAWRRAGAPRPGLRDLLAAGEAAA